MSATDAMEVSSPAVPEPVKAKVWRIYSTRMCIYPCWWSGSSRIQNSFPDPEFFLSDPARMKMKINYNLFIFFGLWILRFWMLGPNMDRIRRIAGSGMNHSGFLTLMVYGNILPVIFKRCFNLKSFNIKSQKAIENCKEETSGDH